MPIYWTQTLAQAHKSKVVKGWLSGEINYLEVYHFEQDIKIGYGWVYTTPAFGMGKPDLFSLSGHHLEYDDKWYRIKFDGTARLVVMSLSIH